MNNKRRAELKKALDWVEQAKSIVDGVAMEEEDALDNLSDNLESSDLYRSIERAVDSLQDANNALYDAQEAIEQAMD